MKLVLILGFIYSALTLTTVTKLSSDVRTDPEQCLPSNSTRHPNVKTMNGKHCFFPFDYNEKTYTDCAVFEGKMKWCPTTCNLQKDKQWSFCAWEKKNLKEPSCKNLTSTKINPLVYTTNDRGCYFPFVSGSKCHTECIGSGRKWCSNVPNIDLVDDTKNYGYCISTVASIKHESCANITAARRYLQPDTASGFNKCVFPFYHEYQKKCQIDCIKGSSDEYWCPTVKLAAIGANVDTNCLYMYNLPAYTKDLRHGIYTIRLASSYKQMKGFYVVANGSSADHLILSDSPSKFLYNQWEIIPQPMGSVIVRAPIIQPCSDSANQKPRRAWGVQDNRVTLETMVGYSKTVRFIVEQTESTTVNATFKLTKIVENVVVDKRFSLGLMDDLKMGTILSWNPVQINWGFQFVEEIDEGYYSKCPQQTAAPTSNTTPNRNLP